MILYSGRCQIGMKLLFMLNVATLLVAIIVSIIYGGISWLIYFVVGCNMAMCISQSRMNKVVVDEDDNTIYTRCNDKKNSIDRITSIKITRYKQGKINYLLVKFQKQGYVKIFVKQPNALIEKLILLSDNPIEIEDK